MDTVAGVADRSVAFGSGAGPVNRAGKGFEGSGKLRAA